MTFVSILLALIAEQFRALGRNNPIHEIVRALDSAGLRVAHIDLQAPTLDDVFLAKTGRTLEGAAEQEAEDEEDAAEVAAAAG